MPKPVPVETRIRAIEAIERGGKTRPQVAAEYGVSVAALGRWLRAYRTTGSVEPKTEYPRGRAPLLGSEQLEALRQLTEEHPHATREDLANLLAEQGHPLVSVPTLSKGLGKLGIRRVRPVVEGEPEARPPDPNDRYKPHHRREPKGFVYPCSLMDAEWELLRPLFEPETVGRGRPSLYPARELLDAMFYVIRTGCPWRMLPAHYPPWQTVYARFRAWTDRDLFSQMHRTLQEQWRVREGREPRPSAGIIDSQTAKTTEKGGLEVGTAPSA